MELKQFRAFFVCIEATKLLIVPNGIETGEKNGGKMNKDSSNRT